MALAKNPSDLVDHFFRNEFGKAVSWLTAKFGPAQLEAAEDAVQEALAKAVQSWSFNKVPDNPTAWIIRVANNKLIDQLRKQQKVYYSTQIPEIAYEEKNISEDLFADEMIKMMFACCNPKLSTEYQLILTLKILGGLSIREIAAALLKKEETIAKSYTRAKKKFREENLKLELPTIQQVQNRLQTVLKTIYLIFNEGYKSTEGDQLIRNDLCEEAMRLNHILLGKDQTNNEWSRSLMALMHFHVSRFGSRMSSDGEIISLKHQDRSAWDQEHINMGNKYLASIKSGKGNQYFIQAAISGLHAAAPSYEKTNWNYILKLYDALFKIQPNPIVALNRIIPLSQVHGPEKALKSLNKLNSQTLSENYLLHAIKADLYLQLGEKRKAKSQLDMALRLTVNEIEQAFLRKKLTQLN